MNGKLRKENRLEVSSDQLRAELIEIKERVGALETIASISNRKEVESYVRGHLKTSKGREIMKECEEPRTREYLIAKFNFASTQALHYYLGPLQADDLIQQHFDDEGVLTFGWSKLFKGLPNSARKEILAGEKVAANSTKGSKSQQSRKDSSA